LREDLTLKSAIGTEIDPFTAVFEERSTLRSLRAEQSDTGFIIKMEEGADAATGQGELDDMASLSLANLTSILGDLYERLPLGRMFDSEEFGSSHIDAHRPKRGSSDNG
jgi:hypothetical protein